MLPKSFFDAVRNQLPIIGYIRVWHAAAGLRFLTTSMRLFPYSPTPIQYCYGRNTS